MDVLVTGASGQLGSCLVPVLMDGGDEVTGWSGRTADTVHGVPIRPVPLDRPDHVRSAIKDVNPQCVVHAAAISRMDACWSDPQRAWDINLHGTEMVVDRCAALGARLVYVSTDMVFDGNEGNYSETAHPNPQTIYGQTKWAAEKVVLQYELSVVVRVSLLFGPARNGRPNFFDRQLESLRTGHPLDLFEDEWRSPVSYLTAARAIAAIAHADVRGLLHVGGPERMSRWEMGHRLARHLGYDETVFRAVRQADHSFPEPRPRDVSLDSRRFRELFSNVPWPSFEASLEEMDLG